MALDCAEVRVGLSGHLYTAPVGSTMPTTTAAAIEAPWVELGYTTEDGVSMSVDSDKEDFNVWQSIYPCRSVVTSSVLTSTFTLVQRNAATLQLAFGGGTIEAGTGDGDFLYSPPSVGLAEAAFIFEVIDGTVIDRYLLYRGTPALTGEINFQKAEMTGYEIEVTHLDSVDGVWQLLSNDPAVGTGVTLDIGPTDNSAVGERPGNGGTDVPEGESVGV